MSYCVVASSHGTRNWNFGPIGQCHQTSTCLSINKWTTLSTQPLSPPFSNQRIEEDHISKTKQKTVTQSRYLYIFLKKNRNQKFDMFHIAFASTMTKRNVTRRSFLLFHFWKKSHQTMQRRTNIIPIRKFNTCECPKNNKNQKQKNQIHNQNVRSYYCIYTTLGTENQSRRAQIDVKKEIRVRIWIGISRYRCGLQWRRGRWLSDRRRWWCGRGWISHWSACSQTPPPCSSRAAGTAAPDSTARTAPLLLPPDPNPPFSTDLKTPLFLALRALSHTWKGEGCHVELSDLSIYFIPKATVTQRRKE